MTTLAYSGMPARRTADAAVVAGWLLVSAAMVFAMAVIGAITRLTESGLSIVEWQPLIGAVPPLSDVEWQRVFALYQQTPEYIHKNAGMDLAGFKRIFFWEWFHRLWGRLIGVAFAVPLVWFWATGRLARANTDGTLGWKLAGLFVLGGLQGALGWYMVMSGLVDRPSVSPYRLAGHLAVACLIYALLLWVAFDLLWPRRPLAPGGGMAPQRLALHAWGALTLVAITMVWGAFVAGLDAGLAYNTFPLMDGRVLPQAAWTLNPAWLNFLDNTALVQFAHRWLAIITAVVVLTLVWRTGATGRQGRIGLALGGMALIQVGLGVSTLVLAVPILLGAAHQAGALLLLGLAVLFIHELPPRRLTEKLHKA